MWAFSIAGLLAVAVNPPWRIRFSVFAGHSHGIPIWCLYAYIVVMGSVVPYLLLVEGLRRISATSVSLLGMLEPVFAAVFAWAILQESLTVGQVSGGILVLGAVVLSEGSLGIVR